MVKKKKDIYTKAEYHKICEHQGKENHKSFQREIGILNFLIVTLDAFIQRVCGARGRITQFNSKQCFYNQRVQIYIKKDFKCDTTIVREQKKNMRNGFQRRPKFSYHRETA